MLLIQTNGLNVGKMAWLAVNKNGAEVIAEEKPMRGKAIKSQHGYWICYSDMIIIPVGSIEKLIGRKLTWQDDAIEI